MGEPITPAPSGAKPTALIYPPLDEKNLMNEHIESLPVSDVTAIVDNQGEVVKADWQAIREEANKAEDYEHSLGFWKALKVYRKYYGTYDPAINDWQVSAAWQSGISQAGNVGAIFGIFIGGMVTDRLGYRKSLIAFYFLIIPFIAITSFAQNKVMLLFGSILCGIPFGVFATLGAAYASEVCPLSLRAYMTGWVIICWGIGGFLATGVQTGTQKLNNNWAFRIPYMSQWIWPIPLILFMTFAPESPWWLVRHGKLEQAERSVKRLGSSENADRASQIVANMVRTTKLEQEAASAVGNSSWLELFKGTDLRRTEITCMAWIVQNACGVIFAGNTTYTFEQAGISQNQAFQLGLGSSGLHLAANFVHFYFIGIMGRRSLFLMALTILDLLLIVIGVFAVYGDRGEAWAKWAQAGFQMGLTAFFWTPICFLCTVWTYFRLPEFKHRSYDEIDILFHRRVSARKFKDTVVERDADAHLE